MAIKALIVQPLMQSFGLGSLGGLFTGSTLAGAGYQSASASTLANNSGGAFFGPGFANGTNDAPGGWSTVGEKGPERMYVPKGATIVPNGMSDGSGGTTQNVYNIDASGADQGTVLQIQKVLGQHAKAISSQGNAMRSAQRMQNTGVG